MPDDTFNETRADVADFLVQNAGNFRFTTTIQNDSLTLAFEPSLPPLHPYNVVEPASSVPSPPYTPLQWEQWDTHSEDSIVAPATGAIQLDPGAPSIPPLPGPLVNGYPTPTNGVTVPSTTVVQDGTMLHTPTPYTPTPSPHSALDAHKLESETLTPPIATIQDNDPPSDAPSSDTFTSVNGHLSHALTSNAFTLDDAHSPNASTFDASSKVNDHPSHVSSPNVYIQDLDHLTNASSTQPFAQVNGHASTIVSSNSFVVDSLVRHETLLNADGSTQKPNGAHVPSNNEVCPSIIFKTSNNNYSNEVNDDTRSSIASTPDIDSRLVNDNVHDTFDTSSHAPVNDLALTPEGSRISQEPGAESNDPEGLLDGNPDHAPSALESTESNETCDVYFIHNSPAEEPPAYTSSTGSFVSNAYSAVPPNSKATLFDSNEHMPSLVPSRPFVPSPLRP
ncbi:hypothetical protein P692DRAFT_20881096, partial [Suillus brevipes Sb2]